MSFLAESLLETVYFEQVPRWSKNRQMVPPKPRAPPLDSSLSFVAPQALENFQACLKMTNGNKNFQTFFSGMFDEAVRIKNTIKISLCSGSDSFVFVVFVKAFVSSCNQRVRKRTHKLHFLTF